MVAKGLAQALVCEVSEQACGECPSCLRIEKEQCESLLLLKPEGQQIKIEQSREVVRFISLKLLGKARVIIIDDAQKLNPQASNALLKSLEEPPENTYFILTASSQAHMLSTIRSRCQSMRFAPLSESDLRAITAAEGWAINSCQGRLDLLEQMNDPDWSALREKAYSVLVRVWEGELLDLSDRLRDLSKDKNTALFSVQCWQSFLRDILFHKFGLSPLANQDHLDLIEKLSYVESKFIFETGQKTIELETSIKGNSDRLLAFENFWLSQRLVGARA